MISKCPKCNHDVPEGAKYCVRCGIKLIKSQRNILFKILITTNIVFFIAICYLICHIVLANSEDGEDDLLSSEYEEVYKESAESKYKLFKHSSINNTDPYGLSNEYNILGKDINEILVGYKEGKDYEITKNDYFCSYSFTKNISNYVKGNNKAKLSIYTDADNDIINIVEYSFRVGTDTYSNSDLLILSSIKRNLTEYYDVDPTYDYIVDYDIVDINKDTFDTLIRDGVTSIYHVNWESEKGRAILTIENLHEERSNDWHVSFTK